MPVEGYLPAHQQGYGKRKQPPGVVSLDEEQGRELGGEEVRFASVDKLIAGGYFDEKEACEAIGVNIDAYKEYLEGKSKE